MKWIVAILACSVVALAQDTCFTRLQLKSIVTGVKVMEYKLVYSDSLISEQGRTIAFQETLLKVRDSVITSQKKIIALHRTNEEMHAETRKQLEALVKQQNPWHESPTLWAVIGLTAGYLLFHK